MTGPDAGAAGSAGRHSQGLSGTETRVAEGRIPSWGTAGDVAGEQHPQDDAGALTQHDFRESLPQAEASPANDNTPTAARKATPKSRKWLRREGMRNRLRNRPVEINRIRPKRL